MITLMLISHAVACGIALALALCNLNKMTRGTHHGIRIAVAMIAVGAFSGLASDLLISRPPSLTEWLIAIGLAAGLISDRRRAHPHGCPCAFITLTKDSHSHGGQI
jgi:hypothetical protein